MRNTLLASAIVALVASGVQAASISYSHVTTAQSIPFTDIFQLPAFAASLGTLTGIEIKLETDGTATVEVKNFTSGPLDFVNATASLPISANGPAGATTSQTLIAGPAAGTVPGQVGMVPGATSVSGLMAMAMSSVNVPSIDWPSYTTPPGTVTLQFSVIAGKGTYTGTADTGVFFGGSAIVGGTTTLTYFYDPVSIPAPAALAIFGLGLLGLGLTRRAAR
jgi:hypothetical protein